jgi:hypothetical protein
MKKNTFCKLFLLVPAFLLCQPSFAAKWRISNVPGVNANFTNLQQANDAGGVAAGDTVYLEGSTVNYTNVTLSKKLIVVGPGFFLGENDSTQANKVPATLSDLIFNPGSENSVLTGISMSGIVTLNAGNIVLKQCFSYNNLNINSSNNVIIQGYLNRVYIYAPSQNNIIKNNILYAPYYTNENCLLMYDGTNAVVMNNLLMGHARISNAEFRNNISSGNGWWNNQFTVSGSCTIKNNICAYGQYTGYPDNITYQDMNAVFACWDNCTGYTSDSRFKLKAGSPAIGYGFNGTDCGIFGGGQPYVLSGIPDFPAVWMLNVDGVTVTVKAKSH